MANRMPEVQDPAKIAVLLIRGYHLSLDAYRLGDDQVERIGTLRQHITRASHQKIEQLRAGDHAIFNDLEQARTELALRQGPQNFRIDEYRKRLMERPDQIFAA